MPAPGRDHRFLLRVVVGVVGCVAAVAVPVPVGVAGGRPVAQPEVPVTPTDLSVTAANNSPALVADPTDPQVVVAAHRVDSPVFSCGLQVSGDGGGGWIGAEPVPVLPEGAERCYAPEVAFDRTGVLYYLFIGLQGAGNEPMGVFLTTSPDHGRTFRPPWMVLGPQNYMVRMAIDRDGGEADRMHLVWLHASTDPPLGGLPNAPNPILAAHSDDGGRTLSSPVQVNDPTHRRAVAPAISLGPDSAVHVAYYDLQDDGRDYQGLEGPAWEGSWSVVATTSLDRGGRFAPPVVVDSRIVPPGRVMLIYTMAPPGIAAGPSGGLYLTWPDAREGDPDVFLARSSDGGVSWEPAIRLNDDRAGRAVTQELPRIGVAPDGRVDAAFLDRRNDPENRRNDVYYTFSTDGGRSFAPNVRLTTEVSDSLIGQRYRVPSAEGLVELGSRIAVLSRRQDAVVAWPDTRNATFGTNQQDIFATSVEPTTSRGQAGTAAAVVVAAVLLAGGAVLVLASRRRSARTGSG